MGPLIVIIALVVLAWVFLAMPQRRRRRMHEAMQDSLEVGDEIITAGGLHATVRELGDDELRIEIAPGLVATLDRRAVAAVAREDSPVERGEAPAEEPKELETAAPADAPPGTDE